MRHYAQWKLLPRLMDNAPCSIADFHFPSPHNRHLIEMTIIRCSLLTLPQQTSALSAAIALVDEDKADQLLLWRTSLGHFTV